MDQEATVKIQNKTCGHGPRHWRDSLVGGQLLLMGSESIHEDTTTANDIRTSLSIPDSLSFSTV